MLISYPTANMAGAGESFLYIVGNLASFATQQAFHFPTRWAISDPALHHRLESLGSTTEFETLIGIELMSG
jgi:hypothetical protein